MTVTVYSLASIMGKKDSKKRKAEEEEAEAPKKKKPQTDVDAAIEPSEKKMTPDEKAAKKQRKLEKKQRKLEKKQAEEAAAAAATAEPQKEGKKQKKDKKKPADADDDENPSAKKAKVGHAASSSSSGGSRGSNNYVVHATTAAMSASDVESYRTEMGIQVYPEDDATRFKPMTSFACLDSSLQHYCPNVNAYLKKKAFTKPSAIQAQCWPPLLSGRDVIGIASTGSGKTLTFLIPAILKIFKAGAKPPPSGVPTPRVLVVAPTRELAMQSHQVVEEVGGLKGVCVYGGVPKPQQKADLKAGADVVVATPGRLLDLMEEKALSLSAVCYLVLDEADRMLDDGFEPVIRQILAKCPAAGDGPGDRQTAMFSATWPEEIRALADKFLRRDVVRVTVGGEELAANHRVTQIVECIEGAPYVKDKRLVALLEKYHKSRTNRCLIFVLYKKEAVTLQNTLQAKGYNVTAIHGDKSQYDRTAALEEFKSGKTPLLIATDVAARGLDIPQVEYVLNYSFPLTVEDYVHRIGRTGRGGATGTSHTFFTDFDKGLAGALVAVLQEANQEVPQEIFKYQMVTKKKTSKLYGDFGPKAELAGKKATKITFD